MREGREYRCPECGTTSPVGVSCSSCRIPMVDEHGNPPLKPLPRPPSWILSLWILVGALVAFIGFQILSRMEPGPEAPRWLAIGLVTLLFGGALIGFGVLRPRIVHRASVVRRRARALGRMGRFPEAAASIARCPDGAARVRGRVKVLRPVNAPRTGAPVAAFELDGEREGGRYAILDESGVALVDDDCFELWTRDPVGAPREAGGQLAEGAHVEIVGTATRRPAPDVAGLGADAHYRTAAASALVFEGRPDEPVLILMD